jgi:hypothetical protein
MVEVRGMVEASSTTTIYGDSATHVLMRKNMNRILKMGSALAGCRRDSIHRC